MVNELILLGTTIEWGLQPAGRSTGAEIVPLGNWA